MTTGDESRRLRLFAAGLASFGLMGMLLALPGLALPGLRARFGLTTAEAGWMLSAFWLGCLGGVAGLYLAGGRLGPRGPLAVMAAGAAGLALSPLWAGVLAGAALLGMSYGALATIFNARVLAAYGPRGPAMFSLLNAAVPPGAMVVPVVFVALSGAYGPAYLALAAMAALVWLGAGGLRPAPRARAGGGRRLYVDGSALLLGALGIGLESVLTGLGPSALIRLGTPESAVAQAVGGFFAAYLVTRLGLTLVANRLSPMAIYAAAMALTALAALATERVAPGLCLALTGAGASLYFHGFFVTATRTMGDDPRVAPMVIASGLIGAIVMPPAVAGLIDLLPPQGFFRLIAVWAALLALASAVRAARTAAGLRNGG